MPGENSDILGHPRSSSDDFNTWRVVYGQFVGADSKYDIIFALNNVPKAQDSFEVRKNNGRNVLRKRLMAGVTLRDLDPGATVYSFSISLNTSYSACNAKTHSRKQINSPIYDRSQNPLISTEHDVMYNRRTGQVVGPWCRQQALLSEHPGPKPPTQLFRLNFLKNV